MTASPVPSQATFQPEHGYWRSLAELADSHEFRQALEGEFPAGADQWPESADRRAFLKLTAASLALAGMEGCSRQPEEKIVPYVRQPAEIVPGEALHYATTMCGGGDRLGVLVKSVMGRPIKIEGNRQHPASLGATSAVAQASLLTLYDPDRSQAVKRGGAISTWDAFLTNLREQLNSNGSSTGSRLRLLTESPTSPTLAWQLEQLLQKFPAAKWHRYDAISRDNERQGAQLAFERDVQPVYDFSRADVVLVLDADPLATGAGQVRYAHDFSTRRRPLPGSGAPLEMSRLYAAETTPTVTGTKADHRLPLRPEEVQQLAWALAQRLGAVDLDPRAQPPASVPTEWFESLADDLKSYRPSGAEGGALIVAGLWMPPVVHALAQRMNSVLGGIGKTVRFIEPPAAALGRFEHSLGELTGAMRNDEVDVLIILGGNPVYNAPADLDFGAAMDRVPLRIHHSLYEDETSRRCHWHLPQAHYLESWSDAWSYDGTQSLVQPLIAPLYQGRTAHELLAALMELPERNGYDLVRAYWQRVWSDDGQEPFGHRWRRALHDGIIADTASPPVDVELADTKLPSSGAPAARQTSKSENGEPAIVLRPDPCIWDGSLANNGWLQELPKPLTKLTWDNAALISPQMAQQLKVQDEQIIEVRAGERTLQVPVLTVPGQADGCVTLHLGYGRAGGGYVAAGRGFNAYRLRTIGSPWHVAGVEIATTENRYPLARTQHHHLLEGRHLILNGTLAELQQHAEHPPFMQQAHHGTEPSFYPQFPYDGYKWGMAINLSACTGCNACVVACQAENNIPIVGKQQVQMGREMHWLRIDQYFHGPSANPTTYNQPLPCMHCEKAPCEVVCPVAATVHTDDGLNAMVYNRCVGTRYCSNNCPYKVRRFNFLQYADRDTPVLQLLRNPEVTVRNRGVMEKCTYCVQRISAARITAERQQRQIRDGEVVTACQAACPSQAIVFGDLNNPEAEVTKLQHSPLNYALLAELNTRPRTTYLAEIRNERGGA